MRRRTRIEAIIFGTLVAVTLWLIVYALSGCCTPPDCVDGACTARGGSIAHGDAGRILWIDGPATINGIDDIPAGERWYPTPDGWRREIAP